MIRFHTIHRATMFMLAALAFASIAAGTGEAKPARRAPAQVAGGQDWTRTVAVAAGGGYVVGNPAARVKLVEFISYTCPHCAHFNQTTLGPLRGGYVRPGKVAVEIRILVRDPVDMTAAMLTNCGDPARFVGNHDLFLTTQERWLALLSGSTEAQRSRWDTGPLETRLKAIAGDFGFYPMMAGRGYSRAQVDVCLADKTMLARLVAQTEGAAKAGVDSTPSFMVDGGLTGVHDWASLEPLLKAAL